MKLSEVPGNLRTIVCGHVFRNERALVFVSNQEGDLCVFCGGPFCEAHTDNLHSIGIGHLFDREPALLELEIEEGSEAILGLDKSWAIMPLRMPN